MIELLVALAGVALSVYALYIEVKKHKDPSYVAYCDFNENMSCSKVLTSEYSKGFGIVQYLVGKEHFLNVPNCILGIVFYTLQMLLYALNAPWAISIAYYTSVVGAFGSIYLAFILFYVLKDICVVCMATYLVNFMLLYLNFHRLHA